MITVAVGLVKASLVRISSGLSGEQKAFNKKLSKERVMVEHTFSRLKKFRVWADESRNRPKHYDRATDIVCGLVNFRTTGIPII